MHLELCGLSLLLTICYSQILHVPLMLSLFVVSLVLAVEDLTLLLFVLVAQLLMTLLFSVAMLQVIQTIADSQPATKVAV